MPAFPRRILFLCLTLLALAGPAAAQPAAPAPTFDSLSTTLTNMGYEPKLDSNGKLLSIVARGAYDLTVNFAIGGDVLAYIYLQKLTADQQARLNMTALLQANDAGPSYFSLARSQDDWMLYVQRSIPGAGVTPAVLRATIDNLVKVTTTNETVWNTRLWK